MANHTENNKTMDHLQEIWVSSVDPNICLQKEKMHNEEPPTMTTTTQLEASHNIITQGPATTVEKATTTTEAEEDTPLFRRRLQRVLGVRFIAAATTRTETCVL